MAARASRSWAFLADEHGLIPDGILRAGNEFELLAAFRLMLQAVGGDAGRIHGKIDAAALQRDLDLVVGGELHDVERLVGRAQALLLVEQFERDRALDRAGIQTAGIVELVDVLGLPSSTMMLVPSSM